MTLSRSVNEPKSQLDNTVRVFDKFYDFDLYVDGNQYDIIYSYFYSISNSKSNARNFTTIIFRIAHTIGESPLTLMEQIKGQNKIETNALLTYYLNTMRSKSTLYGIGIVPEPNQSVQRNVVI